MPAERSGEVLVINTGSSSLKVELVPSRTKVTVERIGTTPAVLSNSREPDVILLPKGVKDHAHAFEIALGQLNELEANFKIIACGHRVVHGGERFSEPTVIDPEMLQAIDDLSSLAPLHNPGNVMGIKAALEALPAVPHVAVFDTAFHSTKPPRAYVTGLPKRFYERQRIRNYGFHGTNHDFVTARAARQLGRDRSELKIVSLHLGNGCSACAVKHGESIDSTMGFTPLAGLLMGTRPGDLDPGIMLTMLERGITVDELTEIVNRESGLKGLSGVSNDMRDIRRVAERGDEWAELAIEIFTYRCRKAIGSLTAAMDGVDAIVFTGGIGQNDPLTREEILAGLEWLGVKVDMKRNSIGMTVFSTKDSTVSALTIPADEEGLIAEQALALLWDRVVA